MNSSRTSRLAAVEITISGMFKEEADDILDHVKQKAELMFVHVAVYSELTYKISVFNNASIS